MYSGNMIIMAQDICHVMGIDAPSVLQALEDDSITTPAPSPVTRYLSEMDTHNVVNEI